MGYIEEIKRLEELDKRYIWHPFTQMKEWLQEEPIIIVEGKGSFLKDAYGRWYLDGISSLWVNVHGHRKRDIDDAIKAQIDKISHSTLLGLSNIPSIELAERLINCVNTSLSVDNKSESPNKLTKVFYSDNGSTSVEIALKMAFQYWVHKGIEGRNKFLSLKHAYHGDTIGSVSVGGIDIFHNIFSPLLFKTFQSPSPYCYRCDLGESYPDCKLACLGEMEEIIKIHSDEIAAVIVEPIIQGAGGVIVWPEGFLTGVRELTNKYNLLLIADEVATGFGRTGKMFACGHEGVIPDILCLSKGITNGYLPLAATITNDEIYNAFLGEFKELKTFFHGHSYTGNPLACAAAIANLDLFEKEKTLENMQPKISILEHKLKEIAEIPIVGNVRNKGLFAGIELVKDKSTKEPFTLEAKMGWKVVYKARERGVLLRPLGNVVVINPPLCISNENLNQLMDVIRDSIIAFV